MSSIVSTGTFYVAVRNNTALITRELLATKLIVDRPMDYFGGFGRIHIVVSDLNLVNTYIEWSNRDTYRIRIALMRESQSWIDFINARIISYGTQLDETDGVQLVYGMSWSYTGAHTISGLDMNAPASFFEKKAEALRWQEVGF